MTTLSVVIPVFNEAAIIKSSIKTILKELELLEGIEQFELLIIDDGSTDATWLNLIELSEDYSQIKALRLTRNFGKESALSAGLDFAEADAVIVMDGDLQHPPKLIKKMLEIWQGGQIDIVDAVKTSRGTESRFSKHSANLFYTVFSKFSGLELQDASDFKLMDRSVIEAWKKLPEKTLFFRGMSAWVGFRRATVNFEVPHRADGESKWGVFKLMQLALNSITAYSSAPLHLITLLGLFFTTFSIFLGSYTLFQKFSGIAVSGFTTVIILLLIIGGAIMIALGVIGIYIARIFDEVKARPRYLILETKNIHLTNK